MKIKHLTLLLLVTINTFSQDFNALKTDVQKMFDLTMDKNYEATFDYTYPKVFEIMPKKELLKVMNSMLDNKEMKITIEKVNPDFIFSKEYTEKKGRYYVVQHNNKMTMQFKEKLGESIDMVLEMMKESMKNYEINIDKKTEIFTLTGKAKIIAISDEFTNGTWKFINYNGDSPLINKLLSKAILTRLGLN